ncbi:MAG: 3-hydroxyacyl-CoA dehydrogenase NAD-binding domain-containing protein, partial [Rhodobacteraceae bacterium]|nr:3-hydroxyacyl-CoA dehydrogenase NAD-binding domain-containing protein [Paracoccaceae bacterium]
MNIQSISVIGAGQMGNGIAHVFALNGYRVVLHDTSEDVLQQALQQIAKNLDRQIAGKKIKSEDKDPVLQR